MNSSLSYRADIDGLRAIAVIAVIIFHVKPHWLPYGFLGVDMFFVISGYLITSIIKKEIEENRFSFLEFYKRRAKRILPVFLFVLMVTHIFTAIFFTPNDFFRYTQSLLASLLFSANLYFAELGGDFYFGTQNGDKPLLHIWSLSVEEQFYFIFPILVLLTLRLFPKRIIHLIIILFIFSIASYFIPTEYSKYYLPHLRAYELLIGASLPFIPFKLKSNKHLPLMLSLYLILLTALLFSHSIFHHQKYVFQITTCIITAIFIFFGSNLSYESKSLYSILRNKFFIFIGLLSYSLYLWHWTLLSIIKYIYDYSIRPWYIDVIFLIFVPILSFLSYTFIENPIRKLNLSNKRFIICMLIYFSLPLSIKLYQMHIQKNSTLENLIWVNESKNCHNTIHSTCTRGNLSLKSNILIVGDSHTRHYNELFDYLGKKENWSADVISSSGCTVILNIPPTEITQDKRCQKVIQFAQENINNYDIIIISSFWRLHISRDTKYTSNLEQTIQSLLQKGKKVYLFKDNPIEKVMYPIRTYRLNHQLGLNIESNYDSSQLQKEVNQANIMIEQIANKYPNVYWVDITKYIPNDSKIDGLPIYSDDDHINPYGARKLAERFSQHETLIKK